MITVTLAMPVYNVSKFVETSLRSALNQTYPNIEYIIVDDKSTDDSMNIVRKVINGHPRRDAVRIIDHVVNKGLGDTRNTSIDNARGEYIFFMDSDDVITPDCIERLVGYMKETPVDFIASSRMRKTFGGKLIAEDVYVPAVVHDDGELSVARFRYIHNNKILAEVWNKLYNTEFLRRSHVRCLPGVHVEDVSFSYQVNLAARSCRLVSDITYTYHIYEGQSFAAFRNNHDRAVYLAECFCKIRQYDIALCKKYILNDEYPSLMKGIDSVSYLHGQMVSESAVLSREEKKKYVRILLRHELSLLRIIRHKHNIINNLVLYALYHIPLIFKLNIHNIKI